MAENIPFGYAPRGMGQQRSVSGDMRYNSMGMGSPRPQPAPSNRQQNREQPPRNEAPVTAPPPRKPDSLPEKEGSFPKNPLAMLGINGLDEEKLILIVLIILLAKNGADWVILAALIYIMM